MRKDNAKLTPLIPKLTPLIPCIARLTPLILMAMLVCVGMTPSAQGASFDCGKASTKVEHIICENSEISKLDDALSVAYKALLNEQPGEDEVKELKASQRNWLKGRNSCGEVECLKRYYDGWLYQYTGRIDRNSPAFKFRIVSGVNAGICAKLLESLNEEFVHNRPACPYDLLTSIPGVTMPEWKKLNLEENKTLYKRFLLAFMVQEKHFAQVFGGQGNVLDEKRLPTREQMNGDGRTLLEMSFGPDSHWRHSTPGMRMDAHDLEGLWRRAVGRKIEFYRWDGVLLLPNEKDVSLIEVSRFEDAYASLETTCPHIRMLRISSDLRIPSYVPSWDRRFATWYISPAGLPFQYENQYFLISQDLPRPMSSTILGDHISALSVSIEAKDSSDSCLIQRDTYKPQ